MSAARKKPAPPKPSWVSRARARGTSKLDDACVDRICDRIARGEFKKHACQAEGVSDETLRLLEREDATIAAATAEAHSRGVEAMREKLDTADDWKRAAWELERFDREAYAPPKQQVESKNEHTGAGGGGVQILFGSVEQACAAVTPHIENEEE